MGIVESKNNQLSLEFSGLERVRFGTLTYDDGDINVYQQTLTQLTRDFLQHSSYLIA